MRCVQVELTVDCKSIGFLYLLASQMETMVIPKLLYNFMQRFVAGLKIQT